MNQRCEEGIGGNSSENLLLSMLFRFRAFIGIISIAAFDLIIWAASQRYAAFSQPWLEAIDYDFWMLFSSSTLVAFLEIKHCRTRYILSSYLLAWIGLISAVLGRLCSSIYTLIETSFYAKLIGGGIIDPTSFRLAQLIIIGILLISVSSSISTIFGEHAVFSRRLTAEDLEAFLRNFQEKFRVEWVGASAFAVGFLVRLYPELITSLPIGWDTIEYISNALDFASSPKIATTYPWLGSFRNLPPLLTYISGFTAWTGLSPMLFYKLYPPIMVGLLSLLSALIAYRLTGSRAASLLSAVAIAFNPWILGQTEQWQRHILGVALLMLYFYIKASKPSYSTALEVSVLVLMAMSYELTCFAAIAISLVEASRSKGLHRLAYLIPLSLSSILLLFYAGYPSRPAASFSSEGLSVAGGGRFYTGLKFTVISLLMLIPFLPALPALRKSDLSIKVALAISLIFSLSYTLFTVSIIPYRWLLVLMTLLTPYAVSALFSRSKGLLAIFTVLIALAGTAYVFTSSGSQNFELWNGASPDWTSWGYPWRMAPAVSNLTVYEYASRTIEEKPAETLMPLSIYPMMHLYIRNFTQVAILSGMPNLQDAVYLMNATGSKLLYVATTHNLTDELNKFMNSTEPSSSAESWNTWFKIEDLRIAELFRSTDFTLYEVSIGEPEH